MTLLINFRRHEVKIQVSKRALEKERNGKMGKWGKERIEKWKNGMKQRCNVDIFFIFSKVFSRFDVIMEKGKSNNFP